MPGAELKSGPQSADRFFDGYARDFEAIYGGKRGFIGRMLDRIFRRSMYLRFKRTIEGCRPAAGRTVLDIGCGPGHYGVMLAKEGAAKVVMLDCSAEMLNLARARAGQVGVADRCEFIQGTFEEYKPAQSLDFCIIMGVMDYIAAPEQFLSLAVAATARKVFISFPAAEGLLAANRRRRYRNRTPLFLYRRAEVDALLERVAPGKYSVEKLARDYFAVINIGPEAVKPC
jgi:SAM-dependent methyltransferase